MTDILAEIPAASGSGFYANKIEKRCLLSDGERAVAEYVTKTFSATDRVLEVGCGYGQLPLLLACLGRNAGGVESDVGRFAVAETLRAEMAKSYPQAAGCQLYRGRYPLDAAPPHDVIVTTNVVNGFWSDWQQPEDEKYAAMFQAPDAIVDARLWWVPRETVEERAAIEGCMKALGFECAGIVGTTTKHWHRNH
jgi:hypothetical protein